MVKEHLEYLVCPACKGDLKLQKEVYEGEFIKEGLLSCDCAKEYPIVNFIPRFVEKNNYADSFGFEWNIHKKTQFDSQSGVEASKKRFYEETKWNPNGGGILLEAGCGCGRFTPYALQVAGGGDY